VSVPSKVPTIGACRSCAEVPRRRALGAISAAAVAAMAGVTLRPGRAESLPLTNATGGELGPGELSYKLPAADGVTIDHQAQVILVRFQQKIYAFALACPHENTALRWRERDMRFRCPRHESQYSPDGTFIQGRATRNMDRFAIRRDGDTVIVDTNRYYRSDQQAAEWAAASVALQ
jgi:nitrite reductase/ring-hydroxylating ferredoxin subunit